MKAQNLTILQSNKFNIPEFRILNSIDELGNIDDYIEYNKRYAIRSSCSVEDNESESHAGEFETFLNITKSDVKEKVQKVFESYNGKTGRVIIQEMIDADLSGVLFTANPIGILNEIVIVTGKGLGENIVEDKVDTTTYYYNTDDKKYYFSGKDDLLSDSLLGTLVEKAISIKELFNNNMDIEFAIKSNDIFILQARPITTLKKNSKIITLDNSNIVESYPGISLPLTQDFAKEIYYKVFRSLVRRLTQDEGLVRTLNNDLKHMVECCNGRMYYNISNWYSILKLLPFDNKIISIWQEMLGVQNKEVSNTFTVDKKTKKKVLTQAFKLLRNCQDKMSHLNSEFERKLPIYEDLIEKCESISTLLSTYKIIMNSLTEVWDITLVNDMYTFLFTALSGKKAKEQLKNIKNIDSMKPVIALNNLVRIYSKQGCSVLYKIQEEEYIKKYGDRCVGELKLETKTYRTNPELLYNYIINAEYIANLNNSDNNGIRDNIFTVRAKSGIKNREISRLNRTKIFGLARNIMLRVGELLEYDGYIDNFRDVFYLYFNELIEPKDYKDLIKIRKEQYKGFENIPNFSRLEFLDVITDKNFDTIQSKKMGRHTEFFGIGSSLGKLIGEVIKIDNPTTDVDTKYKIIVTESTDPGWVFMIKNCSGVIAERGSMLSHTAIITRELGKPSVVNVKGIMDNIQTGDIVELDAYTGIIKILKDI